jgi:RIO kinase 1
MSAPLEVLLADGVIDEVLGRLKSGKEADISLVVHRGEVVAAKIYKDRATRSFKNNAEYTEGRKTRNTRTQRAIDRGGAFGRDAAEQAWKAAEATVLGKLAAHGVRVPRPVMFYEGVLLMELVRGPDGEPARRLIDVALDPQAAGRVFADLRGQMITMLCCDLIHGDLSPYNILAGAAGPTIIDFPQALSAAHASRAQHFFQRDFDNVLRYCAAADPALAIRAADAGAIWRAYVGRYLTPDFVPPPPRPAPPPRHHPRHPGPGGPRDEARRPGPHPGGPRDEARRPGPHPGGPRRDEPRRPGPAPGGPRRDEPRPAIAPPGAARRGAPAAPPRVDPRPPLPPRPPPRPRPGAHPPRPAPGADDDRPRSPGRVRRRRRY